MLLAARARKQSSSGDLASVAAGQANYASERVRCRKLITRVVALRNPHKVDVLCTTTLSVRPVSVAVLAAQGVQSTVAVARPTTMLLIGLAKPGLRQP